MDGFRLAPDGVVEIIKDPAASLPYALYWYHWLRGADKYWGPRIIVTPGETYTPPATRLNGQRYRCKSGGRTGTTPPSFPTSGSADIPDGGVTWVRIGAEDTVSSATVSAESGLTASTPAEVDSTGTVTTFQLSGGALGRDYFVTVDIASLQGRTDQRRFRVKVRER